MEISNRRAADCAWGDGLAPSVEFELRDLGATNLRHTRSLRVLGGTGGLVLLLEFRLGEDLPLGMLLLVALAEGGEAVEARAQIAKYHVHGEEVAAGSKVERVGLAARIPRELVGEQ